MIVIEASAMVDALVGDPADPALLALIADEEMHSPTLLDYEVASALRGHSLAGLLSSRRLSDATGDFTDLDIRRHPLGPMMPAVLGLRDNFTVYDAAYIVLAQVLEAALVTADTKLLPAGDLGVDVRLVRPQA